MKTFVTQSVWKVVYTHRLWFCQGSGARWKPSPPAVQKGKETQRGRKEERTSARHSGCGCERNCYFALWIYTFFSYLRRLNVSIIGSFCIYVSLVIAYHQVWTAAMVHWWHRRNSAPIPAGRPELVAILLGPRNRHNLGWWNGSWQDCADYSVPVLTLQRGLGSNWTFSNAFERGREQSVTELLISGSLQRAVSGQCATLHHHQLGERVWDVGSRFLCCDLHRGQRQQGCHTREWIYLRGRHR